jgi:tetratricopeptide (TPR) repeat protein
VPHLFGAEGKRWLDRLELDHDNFRAAFDWSVAQGDTDRAMCLGAAFWRFWQMRGHLREGRARLDAVLSMPASRQHREARARALEAAGGIAYWQGDMAACAVYYDEALELERLGGDRHAIANALYNASFPANIAKIDLPKAKAMIEEALPIYRSLGDDAGIARCLWALAQAAIYSDEEESAVEGLDEAIRLFRGLGDLFGLGWALFVRSVLALKIGDARTAEADGIEALKIFADANDISGEVLVLDSLAEVARRAGDAVRAERMAGAAAAHEAASGAGLNSLVGLREGWRKVRALSPAESAARAEGGAMSLEQAVAYALNPEGEVEKGAIGA